VYIPPTSQGGWKVTAKDTRGAFSIVESIVKPGTAGPVPHRHSREDEVFYVLEGQYEFRVGDRVISASAGSFLFLPRGIPHTFKNVGTTTSRHLAIISPAGLERFFEERNALGRELSTTDPAYPDRYKVLTEKYGLEYSAEWSFPPKAAE
jgi:quercetin dioxygenase-like cupin family protein